MGETTADADRFGDLISRYVDLLNEGRPPGANDFLEAGGVAREDLASRLEALRLAKVEGIGTPLDERSRSALFQRVRRRLILEADPADVRSLPRGRPKAIAMRRPVLHAAAALLVILACGAAFMLLRRGGAGPTSRRDISGAPVGPGTRSSDLASAEAKSGAIPSTPEEKTAAAPSGGEGKEQELPAGWNTTGFEGDEYMAWHSKGLRSGELTSDDLPAHTAPGMAAHFMATPYPLARMDVDEVLANPSYNPEGRKFGFRDRARISRWLQGFREMAWTSSSEAFRKAVPSVREIVQQGTSRGFLTGGFIEGARLNSPRTIRERFTFLFVRGERTVRIDLERRDHPDLFSAFLKLDRAYAGLEGRIRDFMPKGILIASPTDADSIGPPPAGRPGSTDTEEEARGCDERWAVSLGPRLRRAYRLTSMSLSHALSREGYNPEGRIITPYKRAKAEEIMTRFRQRVVDASLEMRERARGPADAAWEAGDYEPVPLGEGLGDYLRSRESVRDEMKFEQGAGTRSGIITIRRADHPEVFEPLFELDSVHDEAEAEIRSIIEEEAAEAAGPIRSATEGPNISGYSIGPVGREFNRGDEFIWMVSCIPGDPSLFALYTATESDCPESSVVTHLWAGSARSSSSAGSGSFFIQGFELPARGTGGFQVEFRHEGCEHEPGLLEIKFHNSPLPVLSCIVPAEGTVGDRVAIHGGPFSKVPAENIVRFHGVEARVIEAAEARLITEVPLGATNGPITVQVGDDVSDAETMFTVRN